MAETMAGSTKTEVRMPIGAHLREFRSRVVYAVIGIAVGAVAGWFLFDPVFEVLQQPILESAEHRNAAISINFSGLATAFDMRIKVSLFIGLIASSPWWLYQLWAFVSPGLKKPERRYTLGFLGAAIPLFAGGVALGIWVLPRAVQILTDFTPEESTNLIDAQLYLSFVMRILVAFGLGFVFPVVMVALTFMGAVKASTWLRGWRWAIVILMTGAAIITPTPDVVSMLAMVFPMYVLYFAAIGIGALRERFRRKANA